MDNSIILITVDCLRPDHVHAYGYERKTTPNIDRLANNGTLYQNAYSNGPGTRFAFKSLNTGLYPLRISGAGLPKNDGVTLAEALSSAGYHTAGFTNNPFLTRHFNHHRGFDEFYATTDWEPKQDEAALDKLNSIANKIHRHLPHGDIHRILKKVYNRFLTMVESQGVEIENKDIKLINKANKWIQKCKSIDDPYFIWTHLMSVHGPHQYYQQSREKLDISTNHVRDFSPHITRGQRPPQNVIDTYDASIRHADKNIGRLLENINSDTHVFITSDHGEEFGLHDQFHSPSTYQSMARVPLITTARMSKPQIVNKPVSHVDIIKTIINITGVNPGGRWDGESLSDISDNKNIYIGFETGGTMRGAIVSYPWKYIIESSTLNSEPESESIYNLEDDPFEKNDIISKSPNRLSVFRKKWKKIVCDILNNRLEAQHHKWDPSKNLSQEIAHENQSDENLRDINDQLRHLGYK